MIDIKQGLLTQHHLTQRQLGREGLAVEDLKALASLDPLTPVVVEILNDASQWTSMDEARKAGITLPPDAFLVVKTVTGEVPRGYLGQFRDRVRWEEFIVLSSSARRAVDALINLSGPAKSELGLVARFKHEDGLHVQFRLADSFAES